MPITLPNPEPTVTEARLDALASLKSTVVLKTWTTTIDPDTSDEIRTANPDTTSKALVQHRVEALDIEREAGDRLAAVNKWEIVLPWNAVLDVRDQIVHDGETYEVSGTNHGHSNRITLKAQCIKVT